MANHASDIEMAPTASNARNIDLRTRLQCGGPQPANAAPPLGGACSNAASVRSTATLDSITSQAGRSQFPQTSRACVSNASAPAHFAAEPAPSTTSNTASLQALLRLRDLRAALFPEKLFAQPAWDMLLELLECQLRRRRISVSSLYLAAGVPPATALRRIQDMEDAGLIIRVSDPSDRRRQFVELTPQTQHQLQLFFRHGDVLQALRMDKRSVDH